MLLNKIIKRGFCSTIISGLGKGISPVQLFRERRLLYQYTSELLNQPDFLNKQQAKLTKNSNNKNGVPSVYCGYDPTAESLHLGNLVSIIMMARLQNIIGMRPIFLMGGATGLIGDPSGKKQQRDLLAQQRVNSNLQQIHAQIKSVYENICTDLTKNSEQYGIQLKNSQKKQLTPIFINNQTFYQNMNVLTFLRDIGKVLRMSNLLAKQTVANRLNTQNGLSYTQFSYSILQSYDFYMLNKQYGCLLQFGGSDQWGNITNGCDLTKRLSKGKLEGYGITMPLLLSKTGQKFGKSQGNALFLNSKKTPISNVYDYLYNTADSQIENSLYIFTLFSSNKIKQIMSQHNAKPQKRIGQKILAQKVTSWLGTYKNLKQQLIKTSSDGLKAKSQSELQQIYNSLPQQMKSNHKQSQILSQNKNLPDLLAKFGLCKSRNEARKDIEGDGIYINNEKVAKTSGQNQLSEILNANKLSGSYILLRKGKKKYYFIKLQQ